MSQKQMEFHFNVDFIKSEMEKRKMSKTKFAHSSGISPYFIDKILSDNIYISPLPVIKLAKYLGVSIDSLML